jgi:hypothetical protein
MSHIKAIKSHLTTINPYNEVLADFTLSEKDYNENGHLIMEVMYTDIGEIDSKRIFELDENGQVLVQMNYERQNDLIERTEFFDDEESIQHRSEITTASGGKSIYEYHYNQLGNADKITIKNENGEVEGYEIFVFNEKDQVKDEFRMNAENQVEFRKTLTYFDNGLLKEENYYDHGLPARTTSYTYNERNLLTETIDRDIRSNSKVVNQYTYDLAGNQILDETLKNGQLSFKNHCLYDEKNNLIEERVMSIGTENMIEIIRHEITYW